MKINTRSHKLPKKFREWLNNLHISANKVDVRNIKQYLNFNFQIFPFDRKAITKIASHISDYFDIIEKKHQLISIVGNKGFGSTHVLFILKTIFLPLSIAYNFDIMFIDMTETKNNITSKEMEDQIKDMKNHNTEIILINHCEDHANIEKIIMLIRSIFDKSLIITTWNLKKWDYHKDNLEIVFKHNMNVIYIDPLTLDQTRNAMEMILKYFGKKDLIITDKIVELVFRETSGNMELIIAFVKLIIEKAWETDRKLLDYEAVALAFIESNFNLL